jgi:polygalacturonase
MRLASLVATSVLATLLSACSSNEGKPDNSGSAGSLGGGSAAGGTAGSATGSGGQGIGGAQGGSATGSGGQGDGGAQVTSGSGGQRDAGPDGTGGAGGGAATDAQAGSEAGTIGAFLVNETFNSIATGGTPAAAWKLQGPSSVAEVPFAANKSLGVARAAATGNAGATVTFAPAAGRIVVEAKVKAMTTAGHEDLPMVLGADGVTPIVSVVFDGGSIKGSSGPILKTLQSFNAGIWYIVRVVVDTAAQTYDLYVDGTRVQSSAALQANATSVGGVTFDVATGTPGSFYVDDVRVYELGAFIGKPPAPVFDAKALGAKGDGTTKDTVALQNVIDSLPASGGTVYLHDGTFMTGTLRLRSNLTLFIDPTATLKGSPDVADFPAQAPPTSNINLIECRRALLYAEGANNVTIDGGGTIDGNGSLPQYAVNSGGTEVNRPIMFWPVQTSNIMVRNVYFHDGAVWGIVPFECSKVTFDNVYVDSMASGNRDGIDVVDSSDVTIRHTVLHTDDDSICPKSGVAKSIKNLVVHDTAITKSGRANGIKLGTTSYGALQDSTFTDVLIKNVDKGGISIESPDGALVKNVTFQRIEIDRSGAPFFLLLENRGRVPTGSPRKIGTIDGVHFIDVRATNTMSSIGSPIMGFVQDGVRHPLQNITFANVDVEFPGGGATVPMAPAEPTGGYPEFNMFGTLPASAYYLRHVDGLRFTNCRTTLKATDVRPPAAFVDVTQMSGMP